MVSDSCPVRSLSDSALIAAQAHTRCLYLVQRGNRDKRYWCGVHWALCGRLVLLPSNKRKTKKNLVESMNAFSSVVNSGEEVKQIINRALY